MLGEVPHLLMSSERLPNPEAKKRKKFKIKN